jgi:hypothetical protein
MQPYVVAMQKYKNHFYMPLLEALSKLLNCNVERLGEVLENSVNITTVGKFLHGKKLRTSYEGRDGRQQSIFFSRLSLKSAHELPAYEGYLNISVRQHFYTRHKLKLLYPFIPCVTEEVNNGHLKFYPLEFLEIFMDPFLLTRLTYSHTVLKQEQRVDVHPPVQVDGKTKSVQKLECGINDDDDDAAVSAIVKGVKDL